MNNPLLTEELLPSFDHIRVEHMEPVIDQILSDNRVQTPDLAGQDVPTWHTRVQPMQHLPDRLTNDRSATPHHTGG